MIIYIKVYILLYKLSYKKIISNYLLGFITQSRIKTNWQMILVAVEVQTDGVGFYSESDLRNEMA